MTDPNDKKHSDNVPVNESSDEQLPVKNPFDDSDNKKITAEDVENEQQFKEAQTERD
jgi:hypothetical protein